MFKTRIHKHTFHRPSEQRLCHPSSSLWKQLHTYPRISRNIALTSGTPWKGLRPPRSWTTIGDHVGCGNGQSPQAACRKLMEAWPNSGWLYFLLWMEASPHNEVYKAVSWSFLEAATPENLPLVQSLWQLQVHILAPTENAGAPGRLTAPTDAHISIPRTGEC